MTRARYIGIVSAIYMATFLSMFLIAGSWPVQPIYETVPMMVGLSIALAWIITLRAGQLALADSDSFLVPSIMHGAIVLITFSWVIYARISGGNL